MAGQAHGFLTQDAALEIAADAGAALGLSPEKRRVLGPVGGNASVLLVCEGLVLRITSTGDAERVRRELDVATWLNASGVPAVRPARPAPVEVAGWLVSIWHEIPEPRMADSAELGDVLRRLHALDAPVGLDLPQLEPLRGVEHYLGSASGIADESRAYLHIRLGELRKAFHNLKWTLPHGPVHGDAHRKNFAHTPGGDIVAMDLERVSIGPREWDLIVAGVYHDLGWYTDREYAGFTQAYGYDVREWDGYETLAEIRRLRMATWFSARTGREPRLIAEAEHRIDTLRRPTRRFDWIPGE